MHEFEYCVIYACVFACVWFCFWILKRSDYTSQERGEIGNKIFTNTNTMHSTPSQIFDRENILLRACVFDLLPIGEHKGKSEQVVVCHITFSYLNWVYSRIFQKLKSTREPTKNLIC